MTLKGPPVVSANGHTASNERPVTGTEYFGSPPFSPARRNYENWSYVNLTFKLEYCTVTFPDQGEVILSYQDTSLYSYLDQSATKAMAIIKAQRDKKKEMRKSWHVDS